MVEAPDTGAFDERAQEPAMPPTMWTTREPVKLMTPDPKSSGPDVRLAASQPLADQNQWEATGVDEPCEERGVDEVGGELGSSQRWSPT